jgi:hypothetical protein
MTIDLPLSGPLDSGLCPHLAILLRTRAELFPVLASFYALGAKRGGLLVHRSLPTEAATDRDNLGRAGLAVEELEGSGRLAIVEFDPAEPPESSPVPWEDRLSVALSEGLTGLWYSRFAIGPDDDEFRLVMPFEQAWDRAFAGRPVVTLCPYLVGELDGPTTLERLTGVAAVHDGVLVAGQGEPVLLGTAGLSPPTADAARA